MNKSPAFSFYPDKWQSHTRRLSDGAYRVFHELLCWMWQHSEDYCSIKASEDAVACAVAMPIECVRIALAEIQNPFSPLLKVEGEKWICNGLRKEAEKQSTRRQKAKSSANARWDNANAKNVHANASSEQCFPSPSPILFPSPSSSKKESTKEVAKDQDTKERSCELNERMFAIGEVFKRRRTTLWDKREVAAFKQSAATCPIDEFNLVLDYYRNSNSSYLRRDIKTLLNNWNGELDRARAWKEGRYENSQPASTPYSRPLTGAEQRQVGIPASTGDDYWTLYQQCEERKRLAAEASNGNHQPGSGGNVPTDGILV